MAGSMTPTELRRRYQAGGEIAIVDANFPAAATARRLIRIDGAGAPGVLSAVMSLLPLDTFTETPAAIMAVVGKPAAIPPTVREFQATLDGAAGKPVRIERLERSAFYERARHAFAVVQTGERRLYGNVLLTKGVIRP